MGVSSQGLCLLIRGVRALCRNIRGKVIFLNVGHIGLLSVVGKVYGRVFIERVIECTDGAIGGNRVGLGKG